jgi:Uma2 family endonuclease
MATATALAKPIQDGVGDQCVAIRDIGSKGYCTLLRLRGDRPMPRMVYLDGTAWMMSPSFHHERLNKRLGWLIEAVAVELDIPCSAAGATTFRRRAERGGVEGDQTYYLANEERVRGKNNLHLKTDPPPDLAIEAVHSHDADAAIEVYRRFKVPEVWVGDEDEVRFLVLQPNGRYAESSTSASFPFLTAAEVYDWVRQPQTEPDTDWIKQLRTWVKRTLKPRFRARDENRGQEQGPTI